MPPVPLLKPSEVVQTFGGFGWQKGTLIILTYQARTHRDALGSGP